ncbi:MAG TPA: MFS transporter [Chloroflexi bacterium]|jgi:FSR family fosmidomycin resistance protein-like MFS transporter|nr:MFS transporter [Chloroflexota bacterium]
MSIAKDRTLWGVSIGHAAHDVWFGVAPVLLASLSVTMGLANSEIGFILLLYQLVSSLSQPIFGRLSERWGGRPFGVGAILWTTAMFSGVALAESKILLAVLVALAGFGSGAWHPQGAANATVAGGRRWGATAASVFFLGGTLGTTVGSAASGVLLSTLGRSSLLIISALTITVALTLVRPWIPFHVTTAKQEEQSPTTANGATGTAFWVLVVFLLAATALRSLTYHSLNSYVPKYQQDLGASPASYGVLMSLFLFATAIGGVMGSYVADRVGIRGVLVGTMVVAGGLLYGFLHGQGLWSDAAFVLSGLIIGPSHTLFVVAAQRQFPQRMAMISGLILGFTFVSGGGGAWLLGLAADRVGLGTALGVLPWLMLAAAACAFVALPRPQGAHTART